MDKGPWTVSEDGKNIQSDDFTHDVTVGAEAACHSAGGEGEGMSAIVITPKLLREAVAMCDREGELWCGNCLTPDACQLRGMCAHAIREGDAALAAKESER